MVGCTGQNRVAVDAMASTGQLFEASNTGPGCEAMTVLLLMPSGDRPGYAVAVLRWPICLHWAAYPRTVSLIAGL